MIEKWLHIKGHSITTWTKMGRDEEGVSRKSMLGHVTKGRYHLKLQNVNNCPLEGRGIKNV